MSGSFLTVFLVIILAMTSIGGVGYVLFADALTGKNRANKRMSNIAQGERTKDGKTTSLDPAQLRRKAVNENLKELEQRQKEKKAKLTIRALLEQAGLSITPKAFWIGSGVTGFLFTLVGLTIGQGIMVTALMGFVGALGMPRMFLSFLRKKRQKAFTNEFASALDVIVRGIKAGIPLNDCLQIIATESPDPVGSEFKILMDAQKVGVPVDKGLEKMVERMPVPELQFFHIVITIQQSSGGNLSEALDNLSTVLRSRKQMREKVKAMSSEAKASAFIIGILPPGVAALISVTSPDYMMVMFTSKVGNIMLMGGALWMLLGILVMRKMINFDI